MSGNRDQLMFGSKVGGKKVLGKCQRFHQGKCRQCEAQECQTAFPKALGIRIGSDTGRGKAVYRVLFEDW